ncbi:unnamed protein product, partial [Ectocarpus sp. 8 AP-2014]
DAEYPWCARTTCPLQYRTGTLSAAHVRAARLLSTGSVVENPPWRAPRPGKGGGQWSKLRIARPRTQSADLSEGESPSSGSGYSLAGGHPSGGASLLRLPRSTWPCALRRTPQT